LAATDAALVLRTLNGDSSAFSELYDRYARLVRAVCYSSTADLTQAQDLTQEAFLRAYEKLNKLRKPDRFGPWLVTIARNVAREYRRGQFRDRHILVGLAPIEAVADQVEEPDDRLSYLTEAIGSLDEREQLALTVYYLQGKDVEQAKKILGVSRSGLYRLLAQARENIEKFIKARDEDRLDDG